MRNIDNVHRTTVHRNSKAIGSLPIYKLRMFYLNNIGDCDSYVLANGRMVSRELGDTLLCHLFKLGVDDFTLMKLFKFAPVVEIENLSDNYVRSGFSQADFMRCFDWLFEDEALALFTKSEVELVLGLMLAAKAARNVNYKFEKCLFEVKTSYLGLGVFLAFSSRSLFILNALKFKNYFSCVTKHGELSSCVKNRLLTKKQAIVVATHFAGDFCCPGYLSDVTGISFDYCSWCLSQLRRKGGDLSVDVNLALNGLTLISEGVCQPSRKTSWKASLL